MQLDIYRLGNKISSYLSNDEKIKLFLFVDTKAPKAINIEMGNANYQMPFEDVAYIVDKNKISVSHQAMPDEMNHYYDLVYDVLAKHILNHLWKANGEVVFKNIF